MFIPKTIALHFFFPVCLLFFSCKPSGTKSNVTEEPKESAAIKYPALGNQEISTLYANAEKVDMIFYDLPISVNQDDAASAKNSVLYISPAPVEINNSCKALGRLSWISKGVIIKEADIYMDSLCNYFLFMVNNQPVAANAMSESGVYFFKNIISEVEQRQPK